MDVLNFSPEFWFAVAAILSFLLMIRNERFNANKNKKKANTELYELASILVGFIDFVQYTFLHDTSTVKECSEILEKVQYVDKNILDYHKSYFYNDEYDEMVLLKTSDFIQQYVAWKGYHCVTKLDRFSEMNHILALQRLAIEAILEIISVYKSKNNKLSTLLPVDAVSRMNKIYQENGIQAKHFISIKVNLHFISCDKFLMRLYNSFEKNELQLSNLMAACYRLAVATKPFYPFNQGEFHEPYQFFFNTWITKEVLSDNNEGNRKHYFINNEGNTIEVMKVFKLLDCLSKA